MTRGRALAPPAAEAGGARGLTFDRMAVGLLFVGIAVVAALTPAQNDTFWHLRAGADIWASGRVPRADSYSHTAAGAPWPDHEWLAQALMYGVYRAGGMPGLELGAAALLLATAATIYRLMVGPPLVRFALLAIGLAISSCVWTLRPQLLSLLLLVWLVWLLARDRFVVIPPLFLFWANAHGGVALGGWVLLVATAAAIGRAFLVRGAGDRRRAAALALVLPASGLAVAATPLGWGIFRFVVASTARSIGAQISEWYAPRPDTVVGAAFWAAALAFVVICLHRRRALAAGDWTDWVVTAAAFSLLPFAMRSLRNVGPFLTLATPAASRCLGSQFRLRFGRAPRAPSSDHPGVNLTLLAGAGLAALAIVPLTWKSAAERLGWRPIGEGALAALRACPGPLYNQYDDGGTLIWFAPEKPVFIDGRQDPYPPSFLQQDLAIERGAPYRRVFERYRIGCAFLPSSSALASRLRADGWRPSFADDRWTVLETP
jgi:hypothetical protein